MERSAFYPASRQHENITLPARPVTPQPRGRVRRITVAPRGLPPVDALVAVPENPQGLTIHFIGFNQAMGSWEAAKLAQWAALSKTIVVTCELPGFSRYGQPLSTQVRRDLLDGDPSSWGLATWTYLKAAVEAAEIEVPENIEILAFSTGCSLAAAVLPAIQASFEISTLTLIEPVTLASRTIGRLAIHNAADWIRLLKTVPKNYPSTWVRQASLRQLWEPKLRFTPPDFIASVTMLASDDTEQRVALLDLPQTHLVRAGLSKLCPKNQFMALDAQLEAREVPGVTATINGFGHQWWHCLPAVDALGRILYP
ncbi:MAG: hypothetical protein FWD55_05065 [Propionibacteriaceae bacterium]|nr:hypothetical protein [Propionibacteriaceae bacterium]